MKKLILIFITASLLNSTFTFASPGDTVVVRVASAATLATTTSASVTIGGVSADFAVTTEAVDSTPDAFAFAAQSEVALDAVATSAPVTIAGINVPAAVHIVGGEYSIDNGPFVADDGEVSRGAALRVRLRASSTPGAASSATLSVGGVGADFSVTAVGPTTRLVFTLQPPVDLYAGTALAPLQVEQRDAAGFLVNAGGSLDFSVATCADIVDLGSAAFVQGVATYTAAPVFYTPHKNLTIEASMPMLYVASAPFNVIANRDLVFADGLEGCRP